MTDELIQQNTCTLNPLDLKHLKITTLQSDYEVVLIDAQGNEILKGFGDSIVSALNDLHQNLI
ncbi:hypothetical protein J8281_14750 [Aquimarina sp. U1-2]|uniref:hypothetical protein n=1 Tax=Aquimarina sp. U1-2 TaxID=2823141 RepID=UPI001AECC882|nr:hypothetical protein [Aquimarina sp. U1-2]MBP2833452.1 hypothetical protein [Aquimarina sp. U1-2]